jgi:hypothetical protein
MRASRGKRISDPQAEPERVSESQTFVTKQIDSDLFRDEGLALLLLSFANKSQGGDPEYEMNEPRRL